jgi:hypothetical protein
MLHIGPLEVLHIGPLEVERGGPSQVARLSMYQGAGRIAVRKEVARSAAHRDSVHRPDRQGAAHRKWPPEPHNLAHKMRGEWQLLRQIYK